MKITIDTKEDSQEEIRNIIKMLSSLVGEKAFTNQPNIFEDPSPEVKPAAQGNIFGNMFEETKTTEEPGTATEETKTEELKDKDPLDIVREYF